ncbi:hypothetical protein SAMN02745945_02011 [Peptoclostridium litorale DSM 5388]|uniref:Putative permease n=1 Tax=Peptoclostridium litorale DSM 5388 TaxID=1121324 RepID=A0A069RGZ8_PEPLI|nr:efflux transporter SaoE [Peptoclostridium litorale]KDR96281.1 putative permease [Peptoclostridium litorale DSM 5388]SIO15096.1 hypothetical protein SAMN02745945_02011 [Peptoclostridium litorale DSM 5388]
MLIFIKKTIMSGLSILNGASPWIVMSYILAGVLHEVLSPDRFQKMLGNKKVSSILKSTVSGMLLPICSCGTIPLGISLYYSGAYLGPVLAFMTATPIINPIAVILSFGLLGSKVATIYLIAGFVVPLVIGIIGNVFGGPEIKAPGVEEHIQARMIELEEGEKRSLSQKIKEGLKWSYGDLSVTVSKYVIPGMLLAGFMLTAIPQSYIQGYLGDPDLISLGSIAVLAAIMYVCAVGHIPFIAALIASGAAPGVAVTFLMAGAATNLPELISMYKIMGKRTVIIYSSVVVMTSLGFGYMTNKLLMPGFEPVINFDRTTSTINAANKLILASPEPVKYICSFIIFLFFLKAMKPNVDKFKRMISEKNRKKAA